METWVIVILAFFVVALLANKALDTKKTKTKDNAGTDFDYSNGYKQKWLFSYNEKDAYYKIKAITDELGLYLFAKVRLFDLVEPKKEVENKLGHQGKIQSKHVDFVVCDKKLVARTIIELDDNSHETDKRKERDTFVDTVLTNCGYKILHIRAVEPEMLKAELETL